MDLITHGLTAGHLMRHSEFDCIQYPGMGPSHIQCSTSAQVLSDASPKAISGRTSYLRVRLEFLRYPHLIPTLFNGCGSGPPRNFTSASTWTWIGHPVSGLPALTLRPIQTWSPFGSVALPLNLASTGNSPDRSTKSTRSHLNVLPQLVNTGFQVLFHSPPGVLFTFPSQYYTLSVTG